MPQRSRVARASDPRQRPRRRSSHLSSALAALCCGATLTGCMLLPALYMNLATQGATALAAVALGPLDAAAEQKEKGRCQWFAARGSTIAESLETTIPGTEGNVTAFEPAAWRTEFTRDGFPQVESARTPVQGTFSITSKSVYFVPWAGATTVRIPYELVDDVEVIPDAGGGTPRAILVKSCSGRFDIVTFLKRPFTPAESTPATMAAVLLKERLTVAHAAAGK